LVDFDFDPEEIVTWHLTGDMTLREAIIKFSALPPQNRVGVTLWRDRGKEPASFGVNDLEELAQLPEFRE
jgi:hypothetical protein